MDLRVRKTYLALSNAFTSLMEERLYEDITVGALCDRAMIRRTTFYKHFTDKDDFFRFYIRALRDEFHLKATSDRPDLTAREQLTLIINDLAFFFREHESFTENVMKSKALHDLAFSLSDAIMESVVAALEAEVEARSAGDAPESFSVETGSKMITGGIICGLLDWWANGHSDEGLKAFRTTAEALYFTRQDARRA